MNIRDKMVIDLSPYLSKVRDRSQGEPGKQPEVSSGQNADIISLSDKARDIAKLREQLGPVPEMRLDRIADIKGRIDGGTYSVDPAKVADSIIKDAIMNSMPARDGD